MRDWSNGITQLVLYHRDECDIFKHIFKYIKNRKQLFEIVVLLLFYIIFGFINGALVSKAT